jgi:hypothetical protein
VEGKMRKLLLLLALAMQFGLARPTIDDVVDQARIGMRRKVPAVARPMQVAEVAAPYWSPAAAAAGTLILLTALAMAMTSLLVEIGFDWRRPRRIRLRLTLA